MYPVCDVLLSLFCRCDLIEQQVSDLTELHQNEIGNFYKKLADMEENIAHQSYFRATDIDVSFTSHTLCVI